MIVAVLDAGSQYGKVIDRKVRELKVETELLPLDTPASQLADAKYTAIIISGGPNSVYDDNAPKYDGALFDLGKPILGICYGMQMANHYFGGTVEAKDQREDGQHDIDVQTDCILFAGMEPRQTVLLTHGDSLDQLGTGFRTVGRSGGIISAIANDAKKIYGVQFHPEVDLTTNGREMLRNFLFKGALCDGTYTMDDREQVCIKEIRGTVGSKMVLCLVSGGVDSTVCAALLGKALGPEQVIAIHIDNGFMRLRESALVEQSLQRLGLNLKVIDASEDFATGSTTISDGKGGRRQTKALKETVAPEDKRKIIGDTFMRVAATVTKDLNLQPENVFLAQGTLRPDLIESANALASTQASAIKTHHNDTELVRRLRDEGRVIEPLKDYHKDEVRELGRMLGLPEDLVARQPFPGPGLAVRIICAEAPFVDSNYQATKEMLERVTNMAGSTDELSSRVKEAVSADELAALELHSGTVTPTLLSIKTVGVQGDGRTYSYPVALTSDQAPDWSLLMLLTKIIPKICHTINRVVYVFGPRVEGTPTDITPTHLTPDVIAQLQACDHRVNTHLFQHNLTTSISQVPVISFPVHFDRAQGEASTKHSICIRTFITNDFMTGVPAVPGKHMPLVALEAMVKDVQGVADVSRVVYDLTAKPPGTTEWE